MPRSVVSRHRLNAASIAPTKTDVKVNPWNSKGLYCRRDLSEK